MALSRGRLPYVGKATGVARLRESRTPVNMENQLHGDNGEGMAHPSPYPLRELNHTLPSR